MAALRVGNAPCSWGMLEFEEAKGEPIAYSRMLDELVETGYTGTELGDWGYMPTDPERTAGGADQARFGDAGGVCAGGVEGRGRAWSGCGERLEDRAAAGSRGHGPKTLPGAG